jgi:hypothetical protein
LRIKGTETDESGHGLSARFILIVAEKSGQRIQCGN